MWMARERKRVMGEIAGFEMAWLALKLTGEKIDPIELNPYREAAPPKKKSEARIEMESQAGWRLIDQYFGKPKGV